MTMQKTILGFILILHLSGSATADMTAWFGTTTPPADSIYAPALTRAARVVLSSGLNYLRTQVATNETGFVLEPIHTRQVVGYNNNVTVHRRYREITIPKYEYVYEEWETYATKKGVSVDEAMKIEKAKNRRIIGRKVVGEEKRLIRDPEGPIERTEIDLTEPVYDEGPDYWVPGFIGQNAMALYVILRCGVPETDPMVVRQKAVFKHYFGAYGIPDTTFDLAWLTAAFAHIKDPKFSELKLKITSKLLDGQIKEGAATGMWGPACINAPLLAMMIEYQQTLNGSLEQLKKDVEKRPDSKARQKKIEAAEAFLLAYTRLYQDVASQAMWFEESTRRPHWFTDLIKDPSHVAYNVGAKKRMAPDNDYVLQAGYTEKLPLVNKPALPYYVFNQALADVESTSLALFAIREAAEKNALPAFTWRPEIVGKTGLVPPEKPSAVAARAVQKLALLQKENGGWDEANIHQEILAFKRIGFATMTPDMALPMESPQTKISTLQGYSAMIDAGLAMGMKELFATYNKQIMKALQARNQVIAEYMDVDLRAEEKVKEFGGYHAPYDFIFKLRDVHRRLGTQIENDRGAWKRMAYQIVHLQSGNGSWGTGETFFTTTSHLAWLKALSRRDEEMRVQEDARWKEYLPSDFFTGKNELHRVSANSNRPGSTAWNRDRYPHVKTEIFATLYSMIFLLEGVRPPVCGYWMWAVDAQPPQMLSPAVDALGRKHDLKLTFQQLAPELPYADISALPVLFITAAASAPAPSNQKAFDNLRQYIEKGGLVVLEIPPGQNGYGFSSALRTRIAGLVPDLRMDPVPSSAPFLKAFGANAPRLDSMVGKSGRMAVLFLPLGGGQTGAPGLTPPQAVHIVSELMAARAAPGYFAADFPVNLLSGDADMMEERIMALDELRVWSMVYQNPKSVVVEGAGTGSTLDLFNLGGDMLPTIRDSTPKGGVKDNLW